MLFQQETNPDKNGTEECNVAENSVINSDSTSIVSNSVSSYVPESEYNYTSSTYSNEVNSLFNSNHRVQKLVTKIQ